MKKKEWNCILFVTHNSIQKKANEANLNLIATKYKTSFYWTSLETKYKITKKDLLYQSFQLESKF